MSWMEKLCRTYDNCANEVGKTYPPHFDAKGNVQFVPRPLLPLYHTLQTAHIEITLDETGCFVPRTAKVLSKEDAPTILPCTEASANRTSRPTPHALFDTLQYLAGDYAAFGGSKKSGYIEYLKQLEDWCASSFAHPAVCAALAYLKRGCLIADLIADGVLFADSSHHILTKWDGEKDDTPPIFKALANPSSALVRICVRWPGVADDRLFCDAAVRESYISYCRAQPKAMDLCYVQGKMLPRAQYSPRFIRNTGDNAKLISANDSRNFTYRGRFTEATQAFSIGEETTAKAHNALKWLIDRQGWHNGKQVILAWGTQDEELPSLTEDSFDFFGAPIENVIDTESVYAERLNRAMSGYQAKGLDDNANVVVLVLNSATPGRLSIPYYRELRGSEFLERLKDWYKTCAWPQTKTIQNGINAAGKPQYQRIHFVGTPSPLSIVSAAYGYGAGNQLKETAIERLLPCILDRAKIPRDLLYLAVQHASNPLALENWKWQQTLDVTCALVRKYYNDTFRKTHLGQEEIWKMALDLNNNDRSYLFGRILAYYDNIEAWALNVAKENRPTTANRLMVRYQRLPAKTANILDNQLQPYVRRLKGCANKKLQELNELISRLNAKNEQGESNFSDKALSDIFLLGYRSQLDEFYKQELSAISAKKAKEEAAHGAAKKPD